MAPWSVRPTEVKERWHALRGSTQGTFRTNTPRRSWRREPTRLYSEAERTALEYADCMTISGREVDDDLFARLRRFCDDDALVELTAIVAWENASSTFNRALRISSQWLWKRP